MVKLTKIYTKTGDDGTTGLGTGSRVRKDDARVAAYGDVDEANAAVGLAVLACERDGLTEIATLLAGIQHDLFDVGADLCVPVEAAERPGQKLRVQEAQTLRLEQAIDRFNEGMPSLTSFVLPGGSPAAAALHMARTIVRRAERSVVTLRASLTGGPTTNLETVKYLNRLSDLLFVLSRAANRGKDVLWVPGANRQK